MGQVVIASITMGCRAVSPGADLRPDRAHLKDDFLDEVVTRASVSISTYSSELAGMAMSVAGGIGQSVRTGFKQLQWSCQPIAGGVPTGHLEHKWARDT